MTGASDEVSPLHESLSYTGRVIREVAERSILQVAGSWALPCPTPHRSMRPQHCPDPGACSQRSQVQASGLRRVRLCPVLLSFTLKANQEACYGFMHVTIARGLSENQSDMRPESVTGSVTELGEWDDPQLRILPVYCHGYCYRQHTWLSLPNTSCWPTGQLASLWCGQFVSSNTSHTGIQDRHATCSSPRSLS